jgi:hypothetical protein
MATHASPHAQPLHAPQVTAAPVTGGRRATSPWPSLAPWLGAGALMFAGTLVFWLFDSLPFQDLPAHAGIIALRHRFGSSPFEQHYFVVAPHLGPYSLFRFLGDLFVVPLGPVGAPTPAPGASRSCSSG